MKKERTLGDSIEQLSYGRAGIPTGSGIGNAEGLAAWQRELQQGGAPVRASPGTPGGFFATLAFFAALFYFASTGSVTLLEACLYAFASALAVGASVSLICRTRIGRLLIKTVLLLMLLALFGVMAALVAG